MMNVDGQISVAHAKESWVIHLKGDLRADRGAALLKLVHEIAENINSQSQVVVDFCGAKLLDSTILGHLAKLAVLMKDTVGTIPVFINTSNDIRHILKNMGFELIAELESQNFDIDVLSSGDVIEDIVETKQQGLQRVLAAHQLLASLNDENYDKFKDVIEHLRHAKSKLALLPKSS